MKNLIEVSHVSKSYGKVQALRDVSFSVKQGELFGLIGPDGAGKSTLFRILTTLLLPDQGSARVLDADVRVDFRTIRQSVGYMPGALLSVSGPHGRRKPAFLCHRISYDR